jgi:uncharacterized protein (TIGR03032 family)
MPQADEQIEVISDPSPEASAPPAADNGIAKPGTKITCTANPGFVEFMRQAKASLFVTTYQAGKVAILTQHQAGVGMTLLDYAKPLGMAIRGKQMAVATLDRIIVFANDQLLAEDYSPDPAKKNTYDSLYLARASYFTGPLMAHDVAWVGDEILFVNTRYNCIASISQEYSFVPRWKPPFITGLVPEDRCHLNSMALVNGKIRYITALGQYDEAGKWRDTKANGGILMEVPSGEIVMRGLSMPHSVRWYRDKLWFLNSGTGELCIADLQNGKRISVASMQGYTRGLFFAGNYALVGLCQIREKHTFGGLPVQQKHKELLCGVAIIDIRTGQQVGLCKFTSGTQELYEVALVPRILRPTMRMPQEDMSRHPVSLQRGAFWLRLGADDGKKTRTSEPAPPETAPASTAAPEAAGE